MHKGSDAFKEFRPQLAALGPAITGHSYVASDIGYVELARVRAVRDAVK